MEKATTGAARANRLALYPPNEGALDARGHSAARTGTDAAPSLVAAERAPVAVVAVDVPAGAGSVAGCALNGTKEGAVSPKAPSPPRFVTAAGPGLVLGGEPTTLKAVNFSNLYRRNIDGSDLLSTQDHSEADFGRAGQMGFNSVCFALTVTGTPTPLRSS